MPMQEDSDTIDYPTTVDGGASMVAPCPTGPGGNLALINTNEAEVIEASYENTAIVQVGFADDFSTVQGVFRMPGL